MKIKGHIAGLLLICFSVFLGHNLVPHHHHSEAFHSPITTDCPFEHGDQKGHDHSCNNKADADSHPVHCHAFNDVVFEKYSAPALRPWTGSIQAMLVPWQLKLAEEAQYSSPRSYTVFKLPHRTVNYPGSRGLRAPPALA